MTIDLDLPLDQIPPLVTQHWPAHAQAIVDAAIAKLSVPADVEGFEPTETQLTSVLSAICCLTEVAKCSTPAAVGLARTNPPGCPVDLTSEHVAEKYLFWALRLLGVPASPTSANPALQQVSPTQRLSLYHHAASCLHQVFKVPSVSYKAFPDRLKQTLLDAVVAVWVGFPNGEPPIYASGDRGSDHPGNPALDPPTDFVCRFAVDEPQALAAAVMDGRLCSPEVFAQRTIARMQALSRLRTLGHLSHLPSTTAESINIGKLVNATAALGQGDRRLRRVFSEQRTAGACVGVLSELAERMEQTSNGKSEPWSVPNDLPQWIGLVDSFISVSNTIVIGATRSPTAILREVEGLISGGLLRILAIAKRHRPQERKTNWEVIWDGVSMYAFYLEVFPGLYKESMDQLDPTQPLGLSKRYYPSQMSMLHQRLQTGTAMNPRDVGVSSDLTCMKMVAQFVDKKHRVRLCDNLNHHARVGVYEESKTQEEHTCARCHTVVYCSTACQQEDWRVFHRKECVQMTKDYTDAKSADQTYSYENRTFQTTALRYSWESLMPNKDRLRGAIPYSEGRNGVVVPDLFRPVACSVMGLPHYLDKVLPNIPAHLRPRFLEYLKIFVGTNGSYDGADPTRVKAQNRRLLARSFRFGDKDVNLLVLLHRVHHFDFRGKNESETMDKCMDHKERGPEARSDYLVQGVLHFMSPPDSWPNLKASLSDILGNALR